MGEIIKFPSDSGSERKGKIEIDQHLDTGNLTLMLEFLAALTESDTSSLRRPNIEIRRDLVQGAEDGELVTRANQSTESDWKEHPSYYHALIAELRERKLIG
ncbi:hypothetical protein KKB10_03735 [Patescibacteria group bacterium]|nr:hypothetical protein [Patescibacteria group bacterium]MBU1074952.1 hypothetical protein [Patescibacteria group bacterium]MBU1952510.1 hypothetical protein [Patescibacteria group bacterium]